MAVSDPAVRRAAVRCRLPGGLTLLRGAGTSLHRYINRRGPQGIAMIRKIATLAALVVAAIIFGWVTTSDHARARSWNPSETDLARDYSLITDTRNNQDIKMIFWITPPMIPAGPGRQIFDTYVIVGVVRARIAPAGTMSFDPPDTLQASGEASQPLRLLSGDDIPPTVAGMVATMTSMFSQSLGPLGKGIHWFVFDGAAVHACAAGILSIPFANEVYTYQTPIPGCAPP